MDVYLDLSLFLLLIEIMVCIKALELLMVYRIKRSVKITLIAVNLILFFTIKLSLIVSIFLFLIFNMTILIFMNKKKVGDFLIFIIIFFVINFLIVIISKDIKLLNIYLVIIKPIGTFYALIIPLFGLMLSLSAKFIDYVFRLHNYKMNCFIIKNGKKYAYLGYYDSGNTLKYDNVPVIFCVKKYWMYDFNNEIEIEVDTISGKTKHTAYNALINIEDSKEDYFVYVVVIDQDDQFNGCELLLNAYLR